MSHRSRHLLDISDPSNLDQRAVRYSSRSGTKLRPSIHSISWKWPLLLLALGCVLTYITHLVDHHLPVMVSELEALNDTRLFSGERARYSLRKLTDLGPRVVGTIENAVLAPGIIMEELKQAQKNAHPSQSLLYEVQKGSGAYTLEFKPRFTNVYENIQNVVAKVEGSDKKHSILLNCHYDTVPTSEGASDDGLTCSVMLELIRVLTKSDTRLKHNVIFLFNGAEETVLQGSHMFLSHPWASTARMVINLEAGGVGGRPVLFQSGPENPWMIYYYSDSVPHPHGQAMGEVLFQRGFLPSDTDFRIFKDFGKLPGLDIAFIRNGYLYHTKYDKEIYIPSGSFQNLGENILEFLRVLGNAPEFYDLQKHSKGQVVYFDVLGLFFVRYSVETGTKINIGIFLLSCLSLLVFLRRLSKKQAWTEVIYSLLGHVVGMLSGLATCLAMGALMDRISPLAMPWFSSVWLLFPIFWCPCLAAYGLVTTLVDAWRSERSGLSLSTMAQLNVLTAQVPWALLLISLNFSEPRAVVLATVTVLFGAVSNLIIHLTPLYRSVHRWVWVYLCVQAPATMFQLYIMVLTYMFFIPSVGRLGNINADLYIGGVSAVLSLVSVHHIMPLLTLVRKPTAVFSILLALSLVSVPLSLTTSVGQPYSEGPRNPAPQRYWIMHTNRQFYNESGDVRRQESGYFILNLDRNSPRTLPLQGHSVTSLAKDCEEEFYCGLPLFLTRMVSLSRVSSWIPTGPPILPSPTSFIVKERTCTTSPSRCTVKLVIKGPDRLTVTLAPRDGVTLKSWTIPTEPLTSGTWKGRPTYFINIVREDISVDYALTLIFDVDSNTNAPILDLGLAGNYVHHEKDLTKEFGVFLKNFPAWTQITPWISTYISHII